MEIDEKEKSMGLDNSEALWNYELLDISHLCSLEVNKEKIIVMESKK